MQLIAYCWECKTAHDVSNLSLKKHGELIGMKCKKCGGTVVSPSGKGIFRLNMEANSTKRLFSSIFKRPSVY